jgi:hypothetical protein
MGSGILVAEAHLSQQAFGGNSLDFDCLLGIRFVRILKLFAGSAICIASLQFLPRFKLFRECSLACSSEASWAGSGAETQYPRIPVPSRNRHLQTSRVIPFLPGPGLTVLQTY